MNTGVQVTRKGRRMGYIRLAPHGQRLRLALTQKEEGVAYYLLEISPFEFELFVA